MSVDTLRDPALTALTVGTGALLILRLHYRQSWLRAAGLAVLAIVVVLALSLPIETHAVRLDLPKPD